jgi:hypothetical protein
MSFARHVSPSLPSLLTRSVLACGAALLLANAAHAAQTSEPNPPADICAALTRIVEASDFRRLPDATLTDDCRASPHAYDCHWRAHWPADGVINDPLEELGADIAACFPRVVHDVNTPVRQHFVVTTDARRVNVTASVQGQNELRLRVTR